MLCGTIVGAPVGSSVGVVARMVDGGGEGGPLVGAGVKKSDLSSTDWDVALSWLFEDLDVFEDVDAFEDFWVFELTLFSDFCDFVVFEDLDIFADLARLDGLSSPHDSWEIVWSFPDLFEDDTFFDFFRFRTGRCRSKWYLLPYFYDHCENVSGAIIRTNLVFLSTYLNNWSRWRNAEICSTL